LSCECSTVITTPVPLMYQWTKKGYGDVLSNRKVLELNLFEDEGKYMCKVILKWLCISKESRAEEVTKKGMK